MKKIAKRGLLVLLTLALVISAFCISTFAAASQPQTYSKDSNSGTRDVVCTTLDGTSASSYYTGNYSYGTLSNQSSSALYTSLQTLMRSTHTYISSYDDCRDMAVNTDCENEDGSVSLIYTGYSATMSQYNGWNREHVWPQSSGGKNTTGGGADLHHIRPSDAGVNSSRGNKPYGEAGAGATAKYGSNPAEGYLGGTYNSTYFEPNDNVKGDVARICLYVYVRWGSDWGADSITKVFQSVDVLLEWCEMDPVDTWEMGRNEVVEDIQGNRNVFIDYPEYAWILFDREVPDDMTTPSGMARSGGTGSTGSGSAGGSTGGSTGGIVGAPAPETSTGSGTTTTVTTKIATYASANGWKDATQYTSITMDDKVTVTVTGKTNTGKYYTNGNNWRIYQSENGYITLTANEGCTIVSVKFTYLSDSNGVLSYNGGNVGTGTVVDVNASSAKFDVANTGSSTKGQVRITDIEVVYTTSSTGGNTPCGHVNTTTTTVDATCTEAGSTTVTCDDCKEVVSTTITTPATGHQHTTETVTQPTCTKAGATKVTCDDCGATLSNTSIPATGHNYVSGECTVCNSKLPVATFVGPNGSTTATGATVSAPFAPTFSGTGYTFVGWTSDRIIDSQSNEPDSYDPGATISIDKDTTFYALYSFEKQGASVSAGFVKKDLADIKSTDVVVITMAKGSTVYALPNNGGAKTPTATIISISGNTILSSEVTDILKWNISNSNGTLTIYVNGQTTNKLYCINDNAGVRIGDNSNSAFTINNNYLYNTAQGRYVGIYTTNPDWRSYTSINTNIQNQTLAFYVESYTSGTETHYTTVPYADECAHGNTTTTSTATCTEGGTETEICNVCGATVSTVNVPATGHNYVNGTCTNCGHEDDAYLPTCPLDLSKEYNLFVTIDDVKYYVNGIVSGGAFGSSIKSAEAAVFKIESAGNDGEYLLAIKVSRDSVWQYLIIDTSKANGISLGEKAGATVFNWSTEKEALIVTGTGRAISATDGSSFQTYTLDVNHIAASFEIDTVEPSGTPDYDVIFDFGANGDAEHYDGGNASVTYSEKNGVYMITLNGNNFYLGARDAFGNSAIKLGSDAQGTFTFTVPDDVTYIIIRVAKYKNNTSKITVNGGDAITIGSSSDNGEYDEIKINTTENKTVTISTYQGGYRAMINSITYKFDEYVPDAPAVEEDPNCPLEIGTEYVISSNINGWYYLALNSATNGLIGITDIKSEAAYFSIELGSNPTAPYRIYTVIDGDKHYIKNTDENVYLTTSAADATAFLWNDEKSSLATEDGRRLAATTDGFKLYLNSSSWATLTLIENVPNNEGENPNAPTLKVFPYDTNKEHNFFVTIGGVEYYVSGILDNNFKLTKNRAAAIAFTVEKTNVEGEYLISFYDASSNKQYVRITKDATNAIGVTTDRSLATNFTWHTELETLYAPDYNRGFASYNGTNTEVLNSYAISNSDYAWVSYKVDVAEPIDPPSPVDPDNPNGGNGGNEGGNTGGTETTTKTEITFELGDNGDATHKDGSSDKNTYTETKGDYTLNITGGSKMYPSSYDAKGNSCIKLGTGSATGSFTFTVPNNVTSVIIKIAKYKDNASKITVNGTPYTLTKNSNDGNYDEITIDTSTSKTVTVATVSGGLRAMVNSITFVIETTSSDGGSSSAPDTGYDCNTNGHIENENGYCKVCEIAIRTASLVLGSDLSFQFGVNVIDQNINTNGAYMKFFFDEKEIDVTNFKTNGDYIYFIFEGIAPNQMTLPITAVLYVNGKEAGRLENYSVEANLRGILAQTNDDVLKQLIHETLIYGYASQQYKPSGGKDVSIDGITSKNEEASVNDAMSLQGNKDGNVKITAVGVHFDRYNSYYIKVKITDTSLFGKVTVDGVEYGLNDMVKLSEEGEGLYQLYFGKVDATKFDTRVTVELYSSEGIVTRLVYSINAYVYAVQENYDDGSMKTLAIALYNYGKAAEAYYNKYKPQD